MPFCFLTATNLISILIYDNSHVIPMMVFTSQSTNFILHFRAVGDLILINKKGVFAMTKHSIQSDGSVQGDHLTKSQSFIHIPVWISFVVILGALLFATGAIISKVDPTLLTNGSPMTDAAWVYADYFFARNLSLVVMLLFLLGVRARRMLAGFMVLTAFIQLVDVINDLVRGAFLLIPGLIIFAIVFLIGAWQLFGQAIWYVDTWRERS
jgi:hypothetical protein